MLGSCRKGNTAGNGRIFWRWILRPGLVFPMSLHFRWRSLFWRLGFKRGVCRSSRRSGGLRIWCYPCCGLSYCGGTGLILGLGTSVCCGHGQKKKKKEIKLRVCGKPPSFVGLWTTLETGAFCLRSCSQRRILRGSWEGHQSIKDADFLESRLPTPAGSRQLNNRQITFMEPFLMPGWP